MIILVGWKHTKTENESIKLEKIDFESFTISRFNINMKYVWP